MFGNPFVEKLRQFFFEAMERGWAAGSEKIAIPQLSGYKAIEYADGHLHLVDCWCKNQESNASSGFTTIYWKGHPVWTMQYSGRYMPMQKVTDFLKSTILKSYKEKRFYGGRGQWSLSSAGLIYINTVESNDFEKFSGRETIHDTETGQLYGHHCYSGMALFI
ncbi:MAG: hypothetical protein A2288_00835 [Candidatus Moranbacteria bacterium RIFOXYA12_FULL_44_15]|nr:MAG: hypothetical protein A2288_00835 [Candidatus Moranbacteria bacterium RIFOXYA12_FULL_44_15]